MKWLFKPILYLIYLILSLVILYLCFVFLKTFYDSFIERHLSLSLAGENAIFSTFDAIKDLFRVRFHF
jgi:hypothetical protein